MGPGQGMKPEAEPEAEIGTQYRSNTKRIVYLTSEPSMSKTLGADLSVHAGCTPRRATTKQHQHLSS